MKNLMLISIVLLISACSGRIDFPEDPSNAMEQLAYLEEARDARPDWTSQGLWTDGEFTYQVGQSKVFNTERASKKHAVRDASFRLSEYVTRDLDVDFSDQLAVVVKCFMAGGNVNLRSLQNTGTERHHKAAQDQLRTLTTRAACCC